MAKTAKGAGWVIAWRFATRALGLISTLTLVRLLAPADFGLVALGTAFAQAVDGLSVLGVEDVVIREKAPTRDFYNTAFTINVLRGLATALVVAGAAYPAAMFFKEPRLSPILLALAIAALVDAFENIGIVDFRRDFAFDKEFRLQILPRLAGIVLTILFAIIWANYWALIVGIMTTRFLRIVLGYTMHPFRPWFTLRAWRQMIGFSVWTWFISIAGLMLDRSPSIVVGRLLNSTQLGIFTVANEIASLPLNEFIAPVCRACFSGFAAGRHAGVSIAESYLRVIATTCVFAVPAGFGISLLADPIVHLAFGARWLTAIPQVQILAIGNTAMLLGYITSTLLSAHALLSTVFRITLLSVVVRVSLLVVMTLHFGFMGAALGFALSMVVEQLIYLVAICRRFRLHPLDLLRATWRCLLATAVMTGVLVVAGMGWAPVMGGAGVVAARLIVTCGVGAAIYGSVLLILWMIAGRPKGAEADILQMVRRIAAQRFGGARSEVATITSSK